MGAVTEIAQAVSESLLGKNASGFTNAMKRNKDRVDAAKARISSGTGSTRKLPSHGTYGDEEDLRGMKKGGKVRATGRRMLHKGEMVARKAGRSKSRPCGR